MHKDLQLSKKYLSLQEFRRYTKVFCAGAENPLVLLYFFHLILNVILKCTEAVTI